jgi:hypothetical protein
MKTAEIRKQLHDYLEVADDKKINAIYTNEIRETMVEYTPELKSVLDSRVNYYLKGGKMVSAAEMNKRLQFLRKKRK